MPASSAPACTRHSHERACARSRVSTYRNEYRSLIQVRVRLSSESRSDARASRSSRESAGVHTGEVEVRGNDVGGIGVHIAARIAALPGPGEILVSRTVKDLVTGSGITFEDRGTHALKGVPETWQVYAVAG